MGVPVARTSQRAYANGDKRPHMVMRSISLSRIKRRRREADSSSALSFEGGVLAAAR